jgi:hypothetical protein
VEVETYEDEYGDGIYMNGDFQDEENDEYGLIVRNAKLKIGPVALTRPHKTKNDRVVLF